MDAARRTGLIQIRRATAPWEGWLTWSGVVAGIVAAWLWLRSTRVRYVKRRADIQEHEHSIWLTTETPDLLEQPFRTAQLQNRWNARAAIMTAIAVLLQATALIAHQLGR